jgi:hypothetical protein
MAYGAVSFNSLLYFFMSTKLVLDHTSKAAGKWFTPLDVITLTGHHNSQSITSHPNSP